MLLFRSRLTIKVEKPQIMPAPENYKDRKLVNDVLGGGAGEQDQYVFFNQLSLLQNCIKPNGTVNSLEEYDNVSPTLVENQPKIELFLNQRFQKNLESS